MQCKIFIEDYIQHTYVQHLYIGLNWCLVFSVGGKCVNLILNQTGVHCCAEVALHIFSRSQQDGIHVGTNCIFTLLQS